MWKLYAPVIYAHNIFPHIPTQKDILSRCWKVEHDAHVNLTLIGLKISLNHLMSSQT